MPAYSPPSLSAGAMLGRYRIERRLGAGGMGEVYEALHSDLNRRVAIKTLLPSAVSHPDAVARFLREGQATARLRHPHAVDIFDVGVDRGVVFLVMELLDGETLAALIAREAPLAPERVVAIMLPVLAAVQAAHEEGVIHRDLKPANLFLHRGRTGGLVPKVLDFGISKVVDEDVTSLTQSESVLGTPCYMSPEQLRGAKYINARSDQYTLGVILYECVTQRKPFDGETIFVVMSAIASGRFAPPREVVPSLPSAFEEVILRAMDVDPAGRFESVCALGRALLPFADDRIRALWESTFASERPVPIRRASAAPPPASVSSRPDPAERGQQPRDPFADPLSTPTPWSSAPVAAAHDGSPSRGIASRGRVLRRGAGAAAAVLLVAALVAFVMRRRASGPSPALHPTSGAATRAAPPEVFAAPTRASAGSVQPAALPPTSAVVTPPDLVDVPLARPASQEPRRRVRGRAPPTSHRVGTNSIPILR
jgi:serine/threonine-protein kinase